MRVDVAHSSLPAQGETQNGDKAIYRQDGEHHLMAVVDGLGHGPAADAASGTAHEFFDQADLSLPLLELMQGAHRAMSRTRGAAATVCLLSGGKIQACAVGNVEMRSGRLRVPLVASPGVLGTRVSKFRICETQVERAARLILFSDGVSSRLRFDEYAKLVPQELCELIVKNHRKDYDDSTILVADLEPST